MAAKNCQICGKPSGMYPLCEKCFQLRDEGKVEKCKQCGKWHKIEDPCLCQKANNENNLNDIQEENNKLNELLTEKDNRIKELEEQNNTNQEQINDYQERLKELREEITCLICEEPSYGKHFCYNCWNKYRNKILFLKIKNCKECTKLDDEYESSLVCDDGHFVKSMYEKSIDNWLTSKNIIHYYEKEVYIDEKHDIHPDFYIPEYNGVKNIYIEFWGYDDTNKKYKETKEYKNEIYEKKAKEENWAIIYLKKKNLEDDTYKKIITFAKNGEIKPEENRI